MDYHKAMYFSILEHHAQLYYVFLRITVQTRETKTSSYLTQT